MIGESGAAWSACAAVYGVQRLEVFGSAAVGAFRPGENDLDFPGGVRGGGNPVKYVYGDDTG